MGAALELPLHDPDFYRGEPWDDYRALRQRSPVHWHAAGGFWVLSRWADIRWASSRPDLFSNRQGIMIPDAAEIGPGDLDLMLFTDPPRHRELRRRIRDFFAPRRIRALEPRIREITRSLVDPLPRGEPFEFVDRVAAPLPTIVIAELLGIPGRDADSFRRWSDAIIGELDPAHSGQREAAQQALHAYFLDIIADRRRAPREGDFVSGLLAEQVDGRRLSENEIYCMCWLLLTAGNETTRNLIAQGTHALLLHRSELERLGAQPAGIPRAVEEMMRWCTPSTYMARSATRDVELSGQRILAGQRVVMLYAAANRDPEVFGPDAEMFRGTRDPNPHLSFGYGEHVCMGAGLARLEARVCFEELLPRLRRAELAGPISRLRATMTPGIVRFPLRFG